MSLYDFQQSLTVMKSRQEVIAFKARSKKSSKASSTMCQKKRRTRTA